MEKRGTMARTFNGATLAMALLIFLALAITLRSVEAPQWVREGITLESMCKKGDQ